jgi:hypothetical protein
MREPYCPLSSAVCNAAIPTLPLFEMAESGLHVRRSVTFLITLSFVYKVYIGFLSHMHDWTVACFSTVQQIYFF